MLRKKEGLKMDVVLELSNRKRETHQAVNSFHAHNIALAAFYVGRATKSGRLSKTHVVRATIPETGSEFWLNSEGQLCLKVTDVEWLMYSQEACKE
jgi:hypothetical protein